MPRRRLALRRGIGRLRARRLPAAGYVPARGSARREGGDEDRLKELLREEREKVAASEAKRVELEGVLRRMVAEAGGVLG